MTVKRIVTPEKFVGLSSDTKPTDGATSVRPGATYYEYDTDLLYITHDGTNWVTKRDATNADAWMFGKPTLQWLKNNGTESNGRAKWVKEWDRYGEWTAKLSPGVQSAGDDYASVSFTVNNLPLVALDSIEYIYRMGATELCAPNIAIHVFDPTDTDNRADITFSHSGVGLGVSSGWQKFELLPATTAGLFFYHNNVSGSGLTGNTGTNLYTLAQYQADVVFSTYVIGKITIEYGYYTAGYFSPAHICKIAVNDIDIPLEPSIEEQLDLVRDDVAKALTTIPTWTFGSPTLQSAGVGAVEWTHAATQARRGTSGWQAKLTGGDQSDTTPGTNWAAMYVPINELPVPDFTSALWSYYMTNAEVYGFNIVVWVHDPTDSGKRAEITQGASVGGLGKAQYWNAHKLVLSTDQFFWYGEANGSTLTGSGITGGAATLSGWDDYQADALFSTWTIYRISIEYGWYTTGTFDAGWLLELKLNGQVILLKPDPETQIESLETAIDAVTTAIGLLVQA